MSRHNTYPRETVELVEIQVTYSGARIPLAELEFKMVTDGDGPEVGAWVPAVMDGGRTGVWLENELPGRYRVYCRHTPLGGSRPVLDCGTLEIY